MGYDEGVAQRLREALAHRDDIVEKKMFGGLAFMVAGHMCCGVVDDTLMARVGPDEYERALTRPHAGLMDFTGQPLRGFVYVAPAGFDSDATLAQWVQLCARFVDGLPPR